MTLQYKKHNEEMEVDCDGLNCSQYVLLAGTFVECLRELRQLGWMAVQDGEGWAHYCRDCEKEVRDNAAKSVF